MVKVTLKDGTVVEGTSEEIQALDLFVETDLVEAEEGTEEPLEVGDYAVVIDDNFSGLYLSHSVDIGSIVFITRLCLGDKQKYEATFNGKIHYFTESDLRKATQEQVDKAEADAVERKRTEVFTSNGRKVNEYREGDIVRIAKYQCGHAEDSLVEVTVGGDDSLVVKNEASTYGADVGCVEPLVFVENRLDRN